jgi:hypothetical protein
VRSGGFDAIEVSWNTEEPAGGRLLHGATCGELGGGTPGSGFGLSQTARIEGLMPGSSVFLRVAATDIAGNTSALPEPPQCGSVTFRNECAFDDSFEPPRNGWAHAAAVGEDDWRVVASPEARSPPSAFHSENSGDAKDAALTSPAIDIPEGAFLTFFHTFDLEEGFDGARIEASADGETFTDLGSMILEGGYNGSIDGVAAWTGGTIGAMKAVRVSLEGLAGPGRRIRFRILCDDSVGSPGWFIDDVSVCISVPGTSESRFTRGNCSPDDLLNITDAVFLLNHLFLGGDEPACFAACDVDGSDFVNITDAIILLNYLFLGGPAPQPPSGCESLIIPGNVGCEGDSCLTS